MTDYKKHCNWRQHKLKQTRRETIHAVAVMVLALLLYGFVGYLEQTPVVVAANGQIQEGR